MFLLKNIFKMVCLNSGKTCNGKLLWSSLLADKTNKAFRYAWMAAHQAQQTGPSAEAYQNVKNWWGEMINCLF